MNSTPQVSSRRVTLLGAATWALAALAPQAAWAQAAWPSKPVTLLVGFPPGGQTDFAGRVLLGNLQGTLGQAVVIDNKAGVNGNIAAAEVLKANAALNTAMKDTVVTKGIVDRGDEPGGGTPEQLGLLTRNTYKTWGDVVKANNIKAD
jgi:tripartite-type tricarboxylate transporter receptor subunit TctC